MSISNQRLTTLSVSITLVFSLTIVRFFYWQILKSPEISKKALTQLYKLEKLSPKRGKIYTSDNYPLVQNQNIYSLSLYKPNLSQEPQAIINQISQANQDFSTKDSKLINMFTSDSNIKWVTFNTNFNQEQKDALSALDGTTFTESIKRFYPENDLASNILGILAKNNSGLQTGYGGLEGYYQKQLEGKTGYYYQAKDGQGKPLIAQENWLNPAVNGRNLYTSINRPIQYMASTALAKAVEKYQADSGSITIMKPDTGEILAMAYYDHDASSSASLQNPPISKLFEPGSIFKPLVMSMALDKSAISKNYICTQCNRPLTIGEYTISNWNDEVHPDSSIYDIIKNSDNIGMSHIIRQLGLNSFLDYYQKLGLNNKTGIDLQGEARPLVKQYWPEIDFATASFGQGIAITQIQMLTAFNTIANNGVYVQPRVVNSLGEDDKIINIKQKKQYSVYKPETISIIKDVLKYGVENGTVAKFKPDNLEVCAKSGTAQVAIKGEYADNQTIASYIGFSPCDKPLFTMLVTIDTPRTSPWGASTAAPTWYELANRISLLLGIH